VSREIEVDVLRGPGDRSRGRAAGLGLLITWVLVAWGLEVVDLVLPGMGLDRFGIVPRRLTGLIGIPCSPWLHGGFGHLAGNTVAFLGLGTIVMLAEGRRFLATTVILVLVSGLGTWLIGRASYHIGASGLIYGYFGYVMGRAIWEKKILWALVGIAVAGMYGYMIWGVLPSGGPVSWEGHLSGLLAGLWLGWTHVKADRGKGWT
jgi:membrane associated rhomboid family serine protease